MSLSVSYRKGRTHIKLLIILIIIVFLAAVRLFGYAASDSTISSRPKEAAQKVRGNKEFFNKNLYSKDQPASLWAVANKGRVLPSDYVPVGLVTPDVPLRLAAGNNEMYLRTDTADALGTMFEAARSEGIRLMLASGYRSYSQQVAVYNSYVKNQGRAETDKSSARPGHSEHQTGLAADVEPLSRACEVAQCFADTPEGKWVAANSYKYGFILRYPKGQESLTGYEYEPWHVRFVGKELALQIHISGQTLEQFFNLPVYADYPAVSYQLR